METKKLSQMNEVVLSSSNNILSQQMVSVTNTIYVVKNVFNLDGQTIEMANNCILDFRGGALSNGKLKGKRTVIKAPEYQIFDNGVSSKLELLGSFINSSFSGYWFGVTGDGVTDDSYAINYALSNSCKVNIELGKLNHLINSSINFNQDGLRLNCLGTISTNSDITMIDISTSDNNIYINNLQYNLTQAENYNNFRATGVLLSEYVAHCNINIDSIKYVRRGLSFVPVISGSRTYAGSQYNKFTFQLIYARYSIYINLLSGNNKGDSLWMNENQFFGGRLRGQYGVYVERPDYSDPKFDWINGNVFNCIGFEDIDTPVYMYHSTMNDFNNVRMSESIYSDTYIDLLDCNNLNFNIKSYIPYSTVKVEKSCQIQMSRLYCDAGKAMGYDRMTATSSGFPTPSQIQSGTDLKFLYREDTPLNMLRKHYFDLNSRPPIPFNFNELFAKTWDGMLIFSNICQITMYNDVVLNIDLKGSIYRLRPDLILRYDRYGTTSIRFYNDYYSDIEKEIPPVATLNQKGTYKITADPDFKMYIVPLCIDAIQN